MKNSVIEIQETVENGKKVAEIYLSSDLTIQSDLDNLIITLIPLFDKNDEINIFSQKDSEIDISFIQIIVATKKYSKQKNIPVHLNLHLSQTSKDLLKLSGLEKVFKK
ncbi:MAG: hypothetical protein JXL97_11815 [Bacteroidales bacterium]|nr:hypothetical protein [Bacteroidales bacterium]